MKNENQIKGDPSQASFEQPRYCMDCYFCEMTINFEGGSNYICRKTERYLIVPLLERLACENFLPRNYSGR